MSKSIEDVLIEKFFKPLAGKGSLDLQDDAALICTPSDKDIVVSQDAIVENIHFFSKDKPSLIAKKALRVNISDLVAKGASPFGFFLTIAFPKNYSIDWLEDFINGLQEDCRIYNCSLLGGDTVRIDGPLVISINIWGYVNKNLMVKRSGAKHEDVIYVSGHIGDAALGLLVMLDKKDDQIWLSKLSKNEKQYLINSYLCPDPPIKLTSIIMKYATSSIDISDGFIGDIKKLLRASKLNSKINMDDVPFSKIARKAFTKKSKLLINAVTGGDDYQVLFTVNQKNMLDLEKFIKQENIKLTKIGIASKNEKNTIITDSCGKKYNFDNYSFSHF